jgi:biopolymer transport protein ExbD
MSSGAMMGEPAISLLAQRPRRRGRMEFALPTINVIFLLMLYFLIDGTIVQRNELSVAPPEIAEVPTDRLPRPLLLIADGGQFFLDGRELVLGDLAAAAQAATGPVAQSHQLNVLAPAGMEAGTFLDILAALSAAGVPVRVVTVGTMEAGASPP